MKKCDDDDKPRTLFQVDVLYEPYGACPAVSDNDSSCEPRSRIESNDNLVSVEDSSEDEIATFPHRLCRKLSGSCHLCGITNRVVQFTKKVCGCALNLSHGIGVNSRLHLSPPFTVQFLKACAEYFKSVMDVENVY